MRITSGLGLGLFAVVFFCVSPGYAGLLGKQMQLKVDTAIELDETMLWIKEKVDKEHVEYTEIDSKAADVVWVYKFDTTLDHNRCNVRTLTKSDTNQGILKTESYGYFNLKDLISVELVQVVNKTTSTIFVRLKTNNQRSIAYKNRMKFESGTSWEEAEGMNSVFSIRIGTLSTGEGIVRAFKHAIQLCGGSITEGKP